MAEGSHDDGPGRTRANDGRVIFLVEVLGVTDALARVLCPFAVLQVELAFVELRRTDRGASIRLEVEGLDVHLAQLLARRLEQAPTVLRVGLGWCSGTDAHSVRREDSASPVSGSASS